MYVWNDVVYLVSQLSVHACVCTALMNVCHHVFIVSLAPCVYMQTSTCECMHVWMYAIFCSWFLSGPCSYVRMHVPIYMYVHVTNADRCERETAFVYACMCVCVSSKRHTHIPINIHKRKDKERGNTLQREATPCNSRERQHPAILERGNTLQFSREATPCNSCLPSCLETCTLAHIYTETSRQNASRRVSGFWFHGILYLVSEHTCVCMCTYIDTHFSQRGDVSGMILTDEN